MTLNKMKEMMKARVALTSFMSLSCTAVLTGLDLVGFRVLSTLADRSTPLDFVPLPFLPEPLAMEVGMTHPYLKVSPRGEKREILV